MPALDENYSMWNDHWDWSQQGDEWSAAWGGPAHQWFNTLFPRLQGYVPAGRILEIAPGYGRWTHYLKELCSELVIVDLADTAIAHCRERFAADEHVKAYVNDGTSLAMVEDGSVDLVFSFDSLVHVEQDVMYAYLAQIAEKLTEHGVAFLHHSNVGQYPPGSYDGDTIHWRATTVSAQLVEGIAEHVGLRAISQEKLAWGQDTLLNDCLSVITRQGSRWDRANVIAENLTFTTDEIATSKARSVLYPAARRDVAFTAAGS